MKVESRNKEINKTDAGNSMIVNADNNNPIEFIHIYRDSKIVGVVAIFNSDCSRMRIEYTEVQ